MRVPDDDLRQIAKSKPAERGLPFSTWSLAKPADFLVAEGAVDDIGQSTPGAAPGSPP